MLSYSRNAPLLSGYFVTLSGSGGYTTLASAIPFHWFLRYFAVLCQRPRFFLTTMEWGTVKHSTMTINRGVYGKR